MHNILEGVAPFEMALVLQQLIAEGLFSIQQINQIISSWPYGTLDRHNTNLETESSKMQEGLGVYSIFFH